MKNNHLNVSNTITGKKEAFVPIDPKKIGMYVCGPTVYDFPHIGNARPLVVFDVLYRVLSKIFGKTNVTYVTCRIYSKRFTFTCMMWSC